MTITIKQMAVLFGKSEARIRVLITDPTFPAVQVYGQQYGVSGKGNGSGRTPNLYDKEAVTIWLTKKFTKVKPLTIKDMTIKDTLQMSRMFNSRPLNTTRGMQL